jgi:hypothetical protein
MPGDMRTLDAYDFGSQLHREDTLVDSFWEVGDAVAARSADGASGRN